LNRFAGVSEAGVPARAVFACWGGKREPAGKILSEHSESKDLFAERSSEPPCKIRNGKKIRAAFAAALARKRKL